jgi:acetyl esterase/lipase
MELAPLGNHLARMVTARVRGLTLWLLAGACAVAACGTSPSTSAEPTSKVSSETPHIAPGATALVRYCDGQTVKITQPERHRLPAPAAIYLHGGSWIGGNQDSGGFIVHQIGDALNQKGFLVASVNYRLGPDQRWPDQIVDAKCAVRYLRANALALNIDPNEIGVWGDSAGGHLAALLGTAGHGAGWDIGLYLNESSAVEAVADFSGPSNLATLGHQGLAGLVQRNFVSLLGAISAAQVPAALKADSPVTYAAQGDPPFLIIHGDQDSIVPLDQSRELASALRSERVPVSLVVVQGGGHALDEPGERPDTKQLEALTVYFFVSELEHRPSG